MGLMLQISLSIFLLVKAIKLCVFFVHMKLMLCYIVEAVELRPPLSLLSVCPNEYTRPFTVVLLGGFLLPQSHPISLSLSLLHFVIVLFKPWTPWGKPGSGWNMTSAERPV